MNDVYLLRQCAAQGAGIAFVPDALAYSTDEGMVPVLEGKIGGHIHVWLLTTATILEEPRLRLAIEHLTRLLAALPQ